MPIISRYLLLPALVLVFLASISLTA